MKKENEAKLAELNKKVEDFEAIMKSHKREFDVSDFT